MEREHENISADNRDSTLPEGGSVIDALMGLPVEASESPASWERAVSGGLQAALARKMRMVIEREKSARDAA